MNYRKDYIPKSTPNSRRSGISMNPTTITIHNTGNAKSSAANERAWLTNLTNARRPASISLWTRKKRLNAFRSQRMPGMLEMAAQPLQATVHRLA
jgi:hypothetical protein